MDFETYKSSLAQGVPPEGLSMAANGRSQLEGVVERNGGRPQAILAVMRQQIAGASGR